MDSRRATGRLGEEIATAFLSRKGYRILERNVRTRYGEIDIVARDGNCLVFVEVRTVRTTFVLPEESISPRKQHRMIALAQQYLQRAGNSNDDWRADVVAVELTADGRAGEIRHVVNAVEAV
ncbi:MAG TPA: YraN family protein [Chloroflexota bacterium]|nr:YraN family protein [Chloroflexota bacterium]